MCGVALRNIALNLLLEFALPFKSAERTIFENYCVFAAAFAIFKLNVIATAELTERASRPSGIQISDSTIKADVTVNVNTESYVNKSASMISRDLCHNDNNSKVLYEELKAHKMLSPAYVALLIK